MDEAVVLEIDLGALDVPGRRSALPRNRRPVVACRRGTRGREARDGLRRKGFAAAVDLAGSIDARARRVDREMRVY